MPTPTMPKSPSPLMLAIAAICRPGTVRLCSECLAPVHFGEVTCGAAECVASLAEWLDKCAREDGEEVRS